MCFYHIILEEWIQYCGNSLILFENLVRAQFLFVCQYIYPCTSLTHLERFLPSWTVGGSTVDQFSFHHVQLLTCTFFVVSTSSSLLMVEETDPALILAFSRASVLFLWTGLRIRLASRIKFLLSLFLGKVDWVIFSVWEAPPHWRSAFSLFSLSLYLVPYISRTGS